MPPLMPVTRFLLFLTVGVFVLQQLLGPAFYAPFMLWPWGANAPGAPGFAPWQLLTYGLLHGSLMHLLFNMLALWMFGSVIEHNLGRRRYIWFYCISVAGAGLVQLVVATLAANEGQVYPTVGASGGVFGILFAYGMMFPHHRLMLLIPPIPVKAWVLVLCYGLLELFMGVFRTQSGVAHFAHLGGMVFGFLALWHWRVRMPLLRLPRPRRYR